jgi:hypothetical protein
MAKRVAVMPGIAKKEKLRLLITHYPSTHPSISIINSPPIPHPSYIPFQDPRLISSSD